MGYSLSFLQNFGRCAFRAQQAVERFCVGAYIRAAPCRTRRPRAKTMPDTRGTADALAHGARFILFKRRGFLPHRTPSGPGTSLCSIGTESAPSITHGANRRASRRQTNTALQGSACRLPFPEQRFPAPVPCVAHIRENRLCQALFSLRQGLRPRLPPARAALHAVRFLWTSYRCPAPTLNFVPL